MHFPHNFIYSQLRSLTDAEHIFEKLAKISLKQPIPQDAKSSDMDHIRFIYFNMNVSSQKNQLLTQKCSTLQLLYI